MSASGGNMKIPKDVMTVKHINQAYLEGSQIQN
jgi:hypothetical protein